MINEIKNFIDFFNSLDLLLFILKTDGSILFCNQRACDTLGYTQNELINKPVIEIHPLEIRHQVEMTLNQILNGTLDICPFPIQSKDGKIIEVETRIVKGTWDNQPVFFCSTKDVTELKMSNNKFSTIFKFSPIPLAITRISDGKIIEVNQSWLSLLELTLEEIRDKTVYDLNIYIESEDRDDLLIQLQKSKKLENYPVIMKSHKGNILYGLFSGTSILINSENCWITAFVDRTREKKIEELAIEVQNTIIQEARDGILKMLNENQFII